MNNELDKKLNEYFAGRVVRKDLTQSIKSGANIPTFVLEYLLGMYCASDDPQIIENGVKKVKAIIDANFMRYDENDLIKARIKELGSYTIIDKISASLDERNNVYEGKFFNLDIGSFLVSTEYITKYEKILTGGIWVIAKLVYDYKSEDELAEEESDYGSKKKRKVKYVQTLHTPFKIESLKPIQMADIDINEILEYRKEFTMMEWIDVVLRSTGIEPSDLTKKEKFHFLLRMVPLIERNYNMVELGPRSTGKSYLYKEISPYSILVSGGYSSSANLFYNIAQSRLGLVGLWDVVAFDEVAGMRYKDLDVIQIMKDYMTSGSFTRGRESINADASLVFIGNINEKPETLLKISHLFDPFPEEFNNDSAFFDRIHYYLPGWEIPKLKSSLFTNNYGFITDYLAEFTKSMRKKDWTNELNKYFRLNNDVNKRDEISIRKTVSGLIKLVFPDLSYTKEELHELVVYALEGRRRVKEQLKKIAGDEFSAVNLGFVDIETEEEIVVYTTEQPKESIISTSVLQPGHVFCVGTGINSEVKAIFKLENKIVFGEGKFMTEGIGRTSPVKECFNASWNHFKDKIKEFSTHYVIESKDYLMSFIDPQGKDVPDDVSLAELVGLCSIVLNRNMVQGMAVVGHYNLAGSLTEPNHLADIFRVAKNAGATKLLLPNIVISNLKEVPEEYINAVMPVFYSNMSDAVRKALDLKEGMKYGVDNYN